MPSLNRSDWMDVGGAVGRFRYRADRGLGEVVWVCLGGRGVVFGETRGRDGPLTKLSGRGQVDGDGEDIGGGEDDLCGFNGDDECGVVE